MFSSSWLFHVVQNYPHLLEGPEFGHFLMGFKCNPFKIHLVLSKDLFTTMQKIFQGFLRTLFLGNRDERVSQAATILKCFTLVDV